VTTAPSADRLTTDLWSSMAPIYERILAHPFVTGLTDGTLDEAAFQHYIVQDAHYLRDYARALALCAAKASTEADILMFARHAAGAIEVERELHASFFADYGISEDALAATEVAPTCRAYTSYLLAVCHSGSYAEAVAAVLPCYWIYAEVGTALLAQGSPDPRYQRWIDTYGGEEFGAIVAEVLALVDRLGAEIGPAERERMRAHAVTTTRYEWMFWDAGYRRETWPV
jgi:thiaminase/transcriptional activator TenA